MELPPYLPNSKSITLRASTALMIPKSAIYRDKKYFENPNEFNLERFINNKPVTN